MKFLFQRPGSNLKTVSLENVTGILLRKKGNDNYIKTLASSMLGFGMDVMVFVMDSSR